MKKEKKRRERSAYRFVIPLVMFFTVASSVVLWGYIATTFPQLKGNSPGGREALLTIIRDPVVYLTLAGVSAVLVASFVTAVKAVNEERRGAVLLLVLLILTVAAFFAILYVTLKPII